MAELIPITIFNGFLGAGKTTIILNLLKQLEADQDLAKTISPEIIPTNISDTTIKIETTTLSNDPNNFAKDKKYNVVWIKNEFGVNEIDSLLAAQSNITDIKEITNGCLCCTLVGVLSESLYEILITNGINCDRIIIETSGSAFPATLVQEINRIAASTLGEQRSTSEDQSSDIQPQDEQEGLQIPEKLPIYIDGVICVVDALNYEDYSDTSYTAKVQAQYTDIILLNKHELISNDQFLPLDPITTTTVTTHGPTNTKQRLDVIKDFLYELSPETPIILTSSGNIDYNIIFGLDAKFYTKQYLSNTQNNITNETKQALLQNEKNVLSDVDVLHLEWVEILSSPVDKVKDNSVSIYQFENWLCTLSIYNVIRLKGLIVLNLSQEQYQYIIELNNINKKLFSESNNNLISQRYPVANHAGNVVKTPLILNYVLGKWSFYPFPRYNAEVDLLSNIYNNYQYVAPLCTPSSLYQPQYHADELVANNIALIHSKLTLFGKKNSLSTFNFQKMCTRHLPITIRKHCCIVGAESYKHPQDCHDYTGNTLQTPSLSEIATTILALPKYGGFVTILSKEHSHNHY